MPAFRNRLQPKNGKRERLTVSSTPVGFTASKIIDSRTSVPAAPDRFADGAVLQVSGADSIYWTIDGSTPSASIGFIANPGDFIYLETSFQVRSFKAIRVTTDTSIEAQFMWGN